MHDPLPTTIDFMAWVTAVKYHIVIVTLVATFHLAMDQHLAIYDEAAATLIAALRFIIRFMPIHRDYNVSPTEKPS